MNRFPEQQRNAGIRRTRDVTALSRLALLLFCGLVLAGGFVFAAKQHFAAVQLGYKSENLRKERKQLIEDNQRLALEKETVSAPSRLAPAAQRLGLQSATAAQIAKPQPAESQPEVAAEEPSSKEASKVVQASTR